MVINMKFSLMAYSGLLVAKIAFLPNLNLLLGVFLVMVFDFITGVIKSKLQGNDISSKGFRKTIPKLIQNVGLILVGIVMGNFLPKDNDLAKWVTDGFMLFIIYTEVYSIVENLIGMNPDSKVARMIFTPLLSILTLGIDKLSLQKKDSSNSTVLVLCIALIITSCKTSKPTNVSFYEKKDTTEVSYKQVQFKVEGGSVQSQINLDSILNVFALKIVKSQPQGTPTLNVDSLVSQMKKALFLQKPVTTSDKNDKAELRFWFDQYGRVQINCISKDQTIHLLAAEVKKLQTIIQKNESIEVEYKMPWYGWFAVGWAFLSTIIVVAMIYTALRNR
ncbi:MAG: hypothetical protein EAZ35_02170 [Sphingobacteriia bacterium]|nr:MAG: hypothetical protein EAZ35_02170 [Sphingobacteriia bacterium]